MASRHSPVFSPGIPPDIEHAPLIREEALEWLERVFPRRQSFPSGDVLRMADEARRRDLISRMRKQGIGNDQEFDLPDTADALTVLFLRSRGIRFGEAMARVRGGPGRGEDAGPRYGGVWNRLIDIALKRLRRRMAARLLGSAVFALLRDPEDHPNCLVIVKRLDGPAPHGPLDRPAGPGHEYVYRTVLERPAPSCWVLSPFREVLFLDPDQLPTRSEVTSRHFVRLRVRTARQAYELLLGTMGPVSVDPDDPALQFVGRILDIAFLDLEAFHRAQSSSRLEASSRPGLSTADDLQLWLVTQFMGVVHPGSLTEISEAGESGGSGRVLASSVVKPWEPALWDPPKNLEMLAGYGSRVGVPLVVGNVEPPWTSLIESVEPEIRYLESELPDEARPEGYSALALPIMLGAGDPIGTLYLLTPRIDPSRLDTETRVLAVFSRIVGEIVERQRAATHTANVSARIPAFRVLRQEQFRSALRDLLRRTGRSLREIERSGRDMRLPFLLLSTHSLDAQESDPAISLRLRRWLVETLRHLEWRSFVGAHWPGAPGALGPRSFVGELPGVGVIIALDRLVSKDELDSLRSAFPTTINRTSPTNAPVRFVAWVLDVPSHRLRDTTDEEGLERLSDDVERWALDVSTVVEDVAVSESLARSEGEWDAALRTVRKALQKEGGRRNGYLYRLAADCSFSLGDWPSALKYSQEGGALSRQELGSGLVRAMCQQADAWLCLCNPVRAWDLYVAAAGTAPSHPLPRYYRGQGLLLIARLLHQFEIERLRTAPLGAAEATGLHAALDALVDGATEDLTGAADLLDHWGLIPESSRYRNFHLVPTLLGQGSAYLLAGAPGPAASRLQSARRAFPKDDLFFREFLFAKCWEQGIHRQYGELAIGNDWTPLRERLRETFGEPWSASPPGAVRD